MASRNLLERQGYVTFPAVLSYEEVNLARKQLTEIFATTSPYAGDINRTSPYGSIYIDAFTRYPQLRWILFHPKMNSALKSLLGEDFVFVPETAIHDSGFGGWHKDTTSQEKSGHMFQWEPGFLMVQVGIYLQENGKFGGGLDVVPSSHRRRDRFANRVKPGIGEKFRNKLFKLKLATNPYTPYTIPSNAGDMVVFDMRLDHKATATSVQPIPEENRKFAIFMVASVNSPHPRKYVDYISTREDYHYLKNHAYPADLLTEAKNIKINLMPVKQDNNLSH